MKQIDLTRDTVVAVWNFALTGLVLGGTDAVLSRRQAALATLASLGIMLTSGELNPDTVTTDAVDIEVAITGARQLLLGQRELATSDASDALFFRCYRNDFSCIALLSQLASTLVPPPELYAVKSEIAKLMRSEWPQRVAQEFIRRHLFVPAEALQPPLVSPWREIWNLKDRP